MRNIYRSYKNRDFRINKSIFLKDSKRSHLRGRLQITNCQKCVFNYDLYI